MATRKQPVWQQPTNTGLPLKLYNSLTKSKVEFIPNKGRQIKWYVCGPTVYDASHMGHARAYITFDILRRVMEEYFSYDVFYQMNVTDIDDKIILRAKESSSTFRDLASHWEAEFLKDMDQLGVRRPDVMTRVSDYVPKIVTYIEKIIERGYAYESNGSVYFDVKAFDSENKHHYAKLEPNAAFSTQTTEEGEKKAPWDFALWKASHPGDPFWPSPWGDGRPGWHIECSVMASDILGDSIDIHSGGIDLAFPHHDNEMAQAEAYHGCSQWVNYFLHAGHLHIEGHKMSKSLKNFITIKDALKDYSARQIRILFLIHTWYSTLDFKSDSMNEARTIDTTFKNFFVTVEAISRDIRGAHNVNNDEIKLLNSITETQRRVHEAMCDSINTYAVMDELLKLVSTVNVYINSRKSPDTATILKATRYIQRILSVLGIEFGNEQRGSNLEETVVPFLETLATFRDNIRTVARRKDDTQNMGKDILALCDKLRDEDLIELGVRLEDREGSKSLIKLDDRDTLIKERNEKKAREAEKQRKKQEKKRKYNTTIVGGTFDHLHDGHRALLRTAIQATQHKLICGVTHPDMTITKTHSNLIEPLETRVQAVIDFLQGNKVHAEIIVLHDKFGPATSYPEIDAIFVTEENKAVAQEINLIRKKREMKPLEVIVVPLVMTGDQKVSSTSIRSQLV